MKIYSLSDKSNSSASASASSASSYSALSSILAALIVSGFQPFVQLLAPRHEQKTEHDMRAVEQLHRAVEQGFVDEQPHLIIFSTDSGAGDTFTGRATGSSLLVSACTDHP